MFVLPTVDYSPFVYVSNIRRQRVDPSVVESLVWRFSSCGNSPLANPVYFQPGCNAGDDTSSLFSSTGTDFGAQRNGAYTACSVADSVCRGVDARAGAPSRFINLVGAGPCPA